MKLIYYFGDKCKSCKDYDAVVNKVSNELKIDSIYKSIDNSIITHSIDGIPTVIIEDDNGNVIYKNVGNLPYDNLIKSIRKVV